MRNLFLHGYNPENYIYILMYYDEIFLIYMVYNNLINFNFIYL